MISKLDPMGSALDQMRSMAAEAGGGLRSDTVATGAVTGGADSATAVGGQFAQALKASIDKISDNQTHAVGEARAFELGSPNVSLNDVMVDMQKANVGFQFGLQVRNKLVNAYNEIMQTQV
jgi:flagellar hook-basal body complex protein FliE